MAKYRFEQIAINRTEKKKPVEEDRFTYIGLEHLDSGSLKVTRYGSEVAPIGEKLIMRKGDVLFGKRRAYQKKVAIAPFDGIFSAHGMVLRPKEEVIDKDFFPLFISSDYFLDAAIKISVGSLSPTINWRDLKGLEFELPDMEKQKQLASVLWAMNETMESYKKLISTTDELVKSQFIEIFGDPVTNNKDWPSKPLKEVAPEIKPALPMREKYWLLNLDMIETFSGRVMDKVEVTIEAMGPSVSPFNSSMVLYSKLRPYLNKVTVPDDFGYATTELVGFKPDLRYLNREFLFYILRSDEFVKYSTQISGGTQMPRMPMKEMRKFKCILPPLEMQDEYKLFVHQSDKSKFELEQALAELTATYKRIITENFG